MDRHDRDQLRKVLLVEDDAAVRQTLAVGLRRLVPEAVVEAVDSGSAGLSRLQEGGVDVVVADVVIPPPDGFELARQLLETPALQPAYVILITGKLDPDALYEAIDKGADDCLLKPVRPEELAVRVRAGLRRVAALRGLAGRVERSERLYSRQTEFLSTVSHEIRTPLSAIMSAANILLRYGGQRPESVERFAGIIHAEGQRLTRLINNLLDLARIEADEVEWHFAEAGLVDLAGKVRESLLPLARERSVTLRVESRAERTARVDSDRITQVMLNLVSNAIKHSPEGGSVWLRIGEDDGGRVRVEVEDEGPGIPAGMETRIFERFQQLTGEDRRGGTGLGLAISREIVERHGGTIAAAAGRERGALFYFALPVGSGGGV